jgi:hypothetical protein
MFGGAAGRARLYVERRRRARPGVTRTATARAAAWNRPIRGERGVRPGNQPGHRSTPTSDQRAAAIPDDASSWSGYTLGAAVRRVGRRGLQLSLPYRRDPRAARRAGSGRPSSPPSDVAPWTAAGLRGVGGGFHLERRAGRGLGRTPATMSGLGHGVERRRGDGPNSGATTGVKPEPLGQENLSKPERQIYWVTPQFLVESPRNAGASLHAPVSQTRRRRGLLERAAVLDKRGAGGAGSASGGVLYAGLVRFWASGASFDAGATWAGEQRRGVSPRVVGQRRELHDAARPTRRARQSCGRANGEEPDGNAP